MSKNLEDYQKIVNNYLSANVKIGISDPVLAKAMQYSLNAGGKRLRPALTLAVLDAFQVKFSESVLKAACAVELLHTYSLIHDDLPAMDNDDLRRGVPTNHVKFGAGIATLAGDGLLTMSFQWLTDNKLPAEIKSELVFYLSRCAGPAGMVAGQAEDITSEEKQLTVDQLEQLHLLKTGALISYSVMAAGIISQQDSLILSLLQQFGEAYGLAFQIYDDILDVTATEQQLGKAVDKDQQEHKNTYPGLLGLTGAKQALNQALTQTRQLRAQLNAITGHSLVGLDDFFAYFKL